MTDRGRERRIKKETAVFCKVGETVCSWWGRERRRAITLEVKKWAEQQRRKRKEREREREMEEWCQGGRVRERRRLYILPIPPGLASSLFIASHIKVSSLICSTADIVISPAEVIHHQCNITQSPSLSLFFLLYFYHHGGLLVSRSLILSPSLLFQAPLYNFLFSPSTPSLSQFLCSKTTVPKPSHFTDFQRQRPSRGPECTVSLKLSSVIVWQSHFHFKPAKWTVKGEVRILTQYCRCYMYTDRVIDH